MARPRTTGHRMPKQWAAIPGIISAFTADATALGGSLAFGSPATVLRMIGEYTIFPVSQPVVTEQAKLAVAIGVISSDAFAAGAASVPDPSGEPEYPWLYWAEHTFAYHDTTRDPSQAAGSLRHGFDIKSMRKMKPRETLAVIFQFDQLSSTPDLTISMGQTRVLIAGL